MTIDIYEYYYWLRDIVDDRPYKLNLDRYNSLMRYLFNKDYFWIIDLDENRALDGLEIRKQYVTEMNARGIWIKSKPCSVFEMLYGLAIRMDDLTIGLEEPKKVGYWFRVFLNNLGLLYYDDAHFDFQVCEDIMENWLERKYMPNGEGGLFPLKKPKMDQRKVEIWYQMQFYAQEL